MMISLLLQWGTGTDADSSVEYANDALQFIVFTKNYFVWSTPDDEDYENVHMEVTAINNDTDPTTSFGMMCNQQARADNSFYYFAITPAGQYAIAKAAAGAERMCSLPIMMNGNTSDLITKNAPSYRVGADCGKGTLTLYVDGQQIASVSDAHLHGAVSRCSPGVAKRPRQQMSAFDDFADDGTSVSFTCYRILRSIWNSGFL